MPSRSFNPRTRTGCDYPAPADSASPTSFNPRTRTGCDTAIASALYITERFQSTHPHGVRPARMPSPYFATCFNPRTRTGCDGHPDDAIPSVNEFQSTHPHGVRRVRVRLIGATTVVSIHAPARGATRNIEAYPQLLTRFNPRTRTGCDGTDHTGVLRIILFQSTHPHGVRPPPHVAPEPSSSFQSTHPHGVRQHLFFGHRWKK